MEGGLKSSLSCAGALDVPYLHKSNVWGGAAWCVRPGQAMWLGTISLISQSHNFLICIEELRVNYIKVFERKNWYNTYESNLLSCKVCFGFYLSSIITFFLHDETFSVSPYFSFSPSFPLSALFFLWYSIKKNFFNV